MKEEKGSPETRDLPLACRDKPVDITSRSPSDLSRQAITPLPTHLSSLLQQVHVMLPLTSPYICELGLLYTNYIYCVWGFSVCEMMRSL